MKRIFLVASGAVSIAASAAISTNVPPVSVLSAAQIAERNVSARGGLEAWRAVGTLTLSGKLEAGGKKNTELPFVMRLKRPHMSRLEIRFGGQTAVQVYDGEHGWKLRPFLGRNEVEPYSQSEEKAAASWQELDGPLVDYASKGTRLALESMEAVEGHQAYKLKLTLKTGEERRLWVDAGNFLELKIDGEPRKIDGRLHNVAVFYRNYQTENGLTVPHVLESMVEGVKETHKMNIERVAINEPLQNDLFAKPQQMATSASSQ